MVCKLIYNFMVRSDANSTPTVQEDAHHSSVFRILIDYLMHNKVIKLPFPFVIPHAHIFCCLIAAVKSPLLCRSGTTVYVYISLESMSERLVQCPHAAPHNPVLVPSCPYQSCESTEHSEPSHFLSCSSHVFNDRCLITFSTVL